MTAPAGSGCVLAVDPGSRKAGYAVLDPQGGVLECGIVAIGELAPRAAAAVARHAIATIALGRGTNARAVAAALRALGPPVREVDEFETTRRARELYFREHPPAGWRRLLPVGLQTPPRPIDDYAAILIGRRFLTGEGEGKSSKLKPPP